MPISEHFIELLHQMEELHRKKNAGYSGNSLDPFKNFRECEDIDVSAFRGCLVRMCDKWSRVKNLVKNPDNEQVGEAITDTLMDMAVYSLIAICLYEEQNQKKEKGKKDERTVHTEKTDIKISNEHLETEVFWGGGE